MTQQVIDYCNLASLKKLICVGMTLFVFGCSKISDEPATSLNLPDLDVKPETNRWYSKSQAEQGQMLFLQNCASCHKSDASGTKEWKELDENDNLPPPPLNGTAHAWHHPIEVLMQVINQGGIPLGGTMPAFEKLLSKEETLSIIAGFQEHWPDKTYQIWLNREKAARK